MMGAEPRRPNELSPITRIDTARVRPVQSAAGRGLSEPGSPWQNPFVASFGVPATTFHANRYSEDRKPALAGMTGAGLACTVSMIPALSIPWR